MECTDSRLLVLALLRRGRTLLLDTYCQKKPSIANSIDTHGPAGRETFSEGGTDDLAHCGVCGRTGPRLPVYQRHRQLGAYWAATAPAAPAIAASLMWTSRPLATSAPTLPATFETPAIAATDVVPPIPTIRRSVICSGELEFVMRSNQRLFMPFL